MRSPGSLRISRRALRQSALSLIVVASLGIAACSGPGDDGDDPTPTVQPTVTAASASPTATEPPATATATATIPATATLEPTPTPTTEPPATATTAPEEPTAEPTAAPELPTGGAEARIVGKPIQTTFAGDATGSTLYAATSGGLSRSEDGGLTWFASGDVQEGAMIASLDDPHVLYAGENGNCAQGASDVFPTVSEDGGVSWFQLEAGSGIRPLLAEWNANTIVGTDCRLQVSYDGGASWDSLAGITNSDVYAATTVTPGTLTDGLIVLSIGEGGTSTAWLVDVSGIAPSVEAELTTFYGVGAVASLSGRIVIATSTGAGISEDGGASWEWTRDGLEGVTYSVDPLEEEIPEDEQGIDYGFTHANFDPANPDRVWIGGAMGAWWSTNGGRSWAQLGDNSAIDALTISTASNRVIVSSDGGTRVWTLDGE
jgi:hypothetical protein